MMIFDSSLLFGPPCTSWSRAAVNT